MDGHAESNTPIASKLKGGGGGVQKERKQGQLKAFCLQKNDPWLELFFKVPSMFEPLKF